MKRGHSPRSGAFSIYSPDFFLDDPLPWAVPEESVALCRVSELTAGDLLTRIAPFVGPGLSPDELDWMPPSTPFFEECFRDLQALFETGQLTKAVPVFFEHAVFSPTAAVLARWISSLLHAPDVLMPYGRWSGQGGIIGASPELLFEIRDGVLTTVALAGTLSAPGTVDPVALASAMEAFLADPKERKEHNLVIEGITEALAPFGVVDVGETRVLTLPTLWHLQTPIEVTLRDTPSFEALVRRLHPTPALGGTPRDASLEWLRRQDARQGPAAGRGSFGAPFGAQLPDGSAFCLVAVRNLIWDSRTLRIGAGCGVIRESRMEREWEELRQKRSSVKRLLGL